MTGRRTVLAAALLLLPASLAAAAVTGRVRSAEGKPVAGAAVTAYALETFDARAERVADGRERPALLAVKAGGDGSFRIDVPDAVLGIGVRADGFAPAFVTAATGEPVDVTLEPAALRKGRVTSGGAPVAGAILQWTTDLGAPQSAEMLVRTASDGTYEVPDPDEWAAAVAIFHPSFATLTAGPAPKWPAALAHELAPGVRIEGTVTDERSNRPLPGAAIWVDGWPRARSAADGSFVVAHVDRAWSRILARTPQLAGAGKKGAGRIAIRARPVRRLTGVVRDAATHRPVAGVMVSVLEDATRTMMAAAVTDAAGQYALPALPPGKYWPYAARDGYEAPADADAVEAIDLRRALSATHDLELDQVRRIAGVVRDEAGRPVAGAVVSLGLDEVGRFLGPSPDLMGDGSEPGESRTSQADGSFSVPLPRSMEEMLTKASIQVAVMAWKTGYAPGSVKAPAKGAAPLVLTLPAGIAMTGRVVDTDGNPVADAPLSVVEPGMLFASPAFTVALPVSTRSGADGRFAVQVNPGRVALSIRKPGYAPKGMDPLDARDGKPVEVVLDRGAAIRGRVVRADGRGLGAASVALQGDGVPPTLIASSVSDADGRFVLADLAPGTYDLTLSHGASGVRARRTVQVPGPEVRIDLAPTAVVRGRAIDAATKSPLTHFWVVVTPAKAADDAGGERREDILAADGSFAIEDVPLGAATLTVQAEAYRPKSLENVAVSAEADAPALEIALDPGIELAGRVTGDGEPLADAAVTATVAAHNEETAMTDENGDYTLKALPPGEASIQVSKSGYQSAHKTVDPRQAGRLDVALTRGLILTGTVVANDGGVARARVGAYSGAHDADAQNAVTDAAGRFTLQGLSPARYTISAVAEEGKAELKDVDVATSGPVRLVIDRGSHAVLRGTVTGVAAPPPGQPLMVMVSVHGRDGGDAFAIAEPSGAFRIAEAPAGDVTVSATAGMAGATRTAESVEMTLVPGAEATVTIAFGNELEVTGNVTRSGAPVPGAMVSFTEGARSSMATTDREGRYRIGVTAGSYTVSVWAETGGFSTEYVVTDSGVFDIDVTGGAVRGRVVDATSRAAIPAAEVSLWPIEGPANTPKSSAMSTAEGSFEMSSLNEGRYRLVSSKKGYGQEVREIEVPRGGAAEALVEMQPAEGVTVTVTDARDGRTLEAIVVVRDPERRIVANRHAGADASGAVTIALADGPYLLSVSASGYGTATMPIRAPARGLKVALTPGGTLVVETPRPVRGRIKLVQPDGEEYVRCWCNGIAEIKLEGRRTTVENVAAGSYTMELVDAPGFQFSRPVAIREGQVTTVTVELP